MYEDHFPQVFAFFALLKLYLIFYQDFVFSSNAYSPNDVILLCKKESSFARIDLCLSYAYIKCI